MQQGFITLEMSLRGLLRNFGLKVGTISRGRFEQRIRERAAGSLMLEAASEPMLRACPSLVRNLIEMENGSNSLLRRCLALLIGHLDHHLCAIGSEHGGPLVQESSVHIE